MTAEDVVDLYSGLLARANQASNSAPYGCGRAWQIVALHT